MHFKVQGEIQRDEIWKFLERFHEAQGFRSVLSECQEDKCEVQTLIGFEKRSIGTFRFWNLFVFKV